MKVYELNYIHAYNPESGATISDLIVKTTDRKVIDDLIKKFHLKVDNRVDIKPTDWYCAIGFLFTCYDFVFKEEVHLDKLMELI